MFFMKVIPAIIPESKEHLLASIALLGETAKSIQIDMVDGAYAGEASWPFLHGGLSEVNTVFSQLVKDYEVEVDLMMQEPEVYAEYLKDIVQRLVVHMGSTKKLDAILEYRKNTDLKIGLALDNTISLEDFYPYRDRIDFVQCMGIASIGVQGNAFDSRVLPRIREIHNLHPNLEIDVDGHVTMFTLPLLKDAGATRFISGSAIFGSENPQEAYLLLQRLADA